MRTTKPACTATSKRTGKRCGHGPIADETVCKWHGGAAPQVKAKALERLKALQDPAITRLEKLIDSVQDTVALGAVKDVLDRTGLKPPDKFEHSVKVDTDSKTDDQLKARLAEIAADWEREQKARVHAD